MTSYYFLGANTKDGFHSMYSSFPGENAKLHIIKSGPGTGKSSFMRRIGAAAEARGYDVEYILCSGDPKSLDGLYIPKLRSAWVDGTAPHITEPGCFGLDYDYVNLGSFFKGSFDYAEEFYVNQTYADYKAVYEKAYAYLRSAAAFREAYIPKLFGEEQENQIKKRIEGIINRFVGKSKKEGSIKCRFYSAISCLGHYRLSEEVQKLCKQVYIFDNGLDMADFALSYAADLAARRGAEVIACPSPLDPEKLEAVLIPEQSLALLSSPWSADKAWRVHLDNIAHSSAHKKELREGRKTEQKLLSLAIDKLKEAKNLHDGLEKVYGTHMDFAALDQYTESEINKLLQ